MYVEILFYCGIPHMLGIACMRADLFCRMHHYSVRAFLRCGVAAPTAVASATPAD